METRTAIFSKLVKNFMRDVPLAVPERTSLSETVRRMENAKASSTTANSAAPRSRNPNITKRRTDIVLTTSRWSKGTSSCLFNTPPTVATKL